MEEEKMVKKSFGSKVKGFFDKIIHNPTFTLKEQLGFASGTMGNGLAQDIEGSYFSVFAITNFGIRADQLITLMLVAKIVSIIVDPIAGMFISKAGKNGRSRAKLVSLFAPIPLCITCVLIFWNIQIELIYKVIYIFTFYLIYCVADGFYDMSLLTISARMTTNSKDRSSFYTVASLAGTLGGMIPTFAIPMLVTAYKGSEDKVYLIFSIIFAIISFFMMIVPYHTLTEKTQAAWRKPASTKLNFKALALNRPMWLLISSKIVDSIRQICYGGLAYFYLETLDAFWMTTVAGTISATLSYVGIVLYPFISSKVNSRDVIFFGYMYTGILYVIFLLAGYQSLAVVAILIGLAGMPNGAMGVARNVLLADSTDYMEYMTWKKYGEPVRNEAMVFSLNSMSSRIQGFWKDLLLPAALAAIGYVSAMTFGASSIKVVQTSETLNAIFYIVVGFGIAGNFLPAIIMAFDNFHGKKKEAILAELYEMRAQKEAEYQASLEVANKGA